MQDSKYFKTSPKSLAIFVLKLVLTLAAIFYLSKKIDLAEMLKATRQIDPLWFVLSLLSFLLAKWISTYRIKFLFRSLDFEIKQGFNVSAFFIGSFFNLFLPSSVGGDGVKALLFSERLECRKRDALAVVFLDRLSGMAALVAWTALILIISNPSLQPHYLSFLFWPALFFSLPIYIMIQRNIFPLFKSSAIKVALISGFVQLIHLFSAWCLIEGLGIKERVLEYLAVFMASSVTSVLPITIGGLGIREIVSECLAENMGLDQSLAVSVAFLYFIVIVLSSLPGLVLMLIHLVRKKP